MENGFQLVMPLECGVNIPEDDPVRLLNAVMERIEARAIGLNKPAMSSTGSGAHGIMAAMPLYAVWKIRGLPEKSLLRATALSYLICMYIKAYSGRLSALCGCAMAGGTGAACGRCLMGGGDAAAVGRTIVNMASGLTGMICDGGNQGCV